MGIQHSASERFRYGRWQTQQTKTLLAKVRSGLARVKQISDMYSIFIYATPFVCRVATQFLKLKVSVFSKIIPCFHRYFPCPCQSSQTTSMHLTSQLKLHGSKLYWFEIHHAQAFMDIITFSMFSLDLCEVLPSL